MKVAICFLALFGIYTACFAQERIQEQVSVDWWVVPLFAVDRDGNAITDLKKEELKLFVNKRPTAEFVLTRRLFDVEEKLPQAQPVAVAEKKRMMFFVFDNAFSNLGNFKKSLRIARSLVQGSARSTPFYIFLMDPRAGLVFLGGPLEQKAEILALIEKKVVLNPGTRSMEASTATSSGLLRDSVRDSRYGGREKNFFSEEQDGTFLKNISKNYLRSIQNLAIALNGMQDNKFVYLFSEGISLFSSQIVPHQNAEFRKLINKSAGLLGRSGAVLFIINPAGLSLSLNNENSGEDSLRELAAKSGGKYLEGETQNISRRIQNMHRAYYELAFPEQSDGSGAVRSLVINSTRPGVNVHTIHSLEKNRPYAGLDRIEKEILALNLINHNPFFLKRITLTDMIVKNRQQRENKQIFEIVIPDAWLGQKLDLYKTSIDQVSGDTDIEKSTWLAETTGKIVELDNPGGKKVGFVVINPEAQAALLLKPETEKTDTPLAEKVPETKP